jgi:peroxin-14
VPLIAPPTPPQLEQDKASIDTSFEKAFTLLDQLASDTEALKTSDEARTERLDAALAEVESVIGTLKSASRRREEESRRITDEVRGIKDMIPKAMEGQKESTDIRLQELNTELKSLKKLMGQRMNPIQASPAPGTPTYGRAAGSSALYTPSAPVLTSTAATTTITPAVSTEATSPKPATVSSDVGTEATASIVNRSSSPFGAGIPSGRAAIPAWQRAAASKSSSSGTATPNQIPAVISTDSVSQEASGPA